MKEKDENDKMLTILRKNVTALTKKGANAKPEGIRYRPNLFYQDYIIVILVMMIVMKIMRTTMRMVIIIHKHIGTQ